MTASPVATSRTQIAARPQFTRHPMKASMAVLWETGALAKRLLSLHRARDAALEPIEGGANEAWKSGEGEKTGNEVGKTMDASLRAVRWPRHLRLFAQHAYAMAAENHVAVPLGWTRTPTRIPDGRIQPRSICCPLSTASTSKAACGTREMRSWSCWRRWPRWEARMHAATRRRRCDIDRSDGTGPNDTSSRPAG